MKLLIAVAAGLLGYCYKCGLDARKHRVTLKEDMHRWEDEGGNVPAVATPSPAPVPVTSIPMGDTPLRH